jgi:hypothetical protein
MVREAVQHDRLRGALWGMFVGDALVPPGRDPAGDGQCGLRERPGVATGAPGRWWASGSDWAADSHRVPRRHKPRCSPQPHRQDVSRP